MKKINLLDLLVDKIQSELKEMGQQGFRAKQIFQWLSKGVKDFDMMTNLSKALRDELREHFYIGKLEILQKYKSKIDSTCKYLFKLEDGNIIESVLMEYKHGLTICISTQAGCRMGCKFCASTGIGFERNLTPGEILDQVLSIQNDIGEDIGNIVLMGIGEPFDNYDNVMEFLRLIHSEDGLNIGYRRITVSTCGLVNGIERFTKENMPVNLSVSLHAPNDCIREKLMPVNKKYSIDKLIEACKIYTEMTKRRITFEYAVIRGVNDSKENALELSRRIKGMLCHVNLIPVNTVDGVGFKHGERRAIEEFKSITEKYGIETTVRRELGTDIEAACGQLRKRQIEANG